MPGYGIDEVFGSGGDSGAMGVEEEEITNINRLLFFY
jgi:hypothetical protein